MKARKFVSREQNERNKVSIVIETNEADAEQLEKVMRKAIRKMNRLVNGKLSFQVLVIHPNSKNLEV